MYNIILQETLDNIPFKIRNKTKTPTNAIAVHISVITNKKGQIKYKDEEVW